MPDHVEGTDTEREPLRAPIHHDNGPGGVVTHEYQPRLCPSCAQLGLDLAEAIQAERDAALTERDELREALAKYGYHDSRCPAFSGRPSCDCGFTAVLSRETTDSPSCPTCRNPRNSPAQDDTGTGGGSLCPDPFHTTDSGEAR